MNEVKKQRLEKQVLRLMAELYFRELKNDDIGYATFTRCQMSSDLSHAKIFVSILDGELVGARVGDGTPNSVRKTMKALNRAKGFVKGKIGRALAIRTIPDIEFVLDTSFSEGARIERLIAGNSAPPVSDESDAEKSV